MTTTTEHASPLSVFAQGLEQTKVALGFLPLNDCAPMIVAQELGLFAAAGLDVELLPQAAWATVRDKLALGALDAAQMMPGMLFSTTLGMRGVAKHLITAFSFGLNGNAITLSNRIVDQIDGVDLSQRAMSASCLKPVMAKRPNGQPLTLAHVYPVSTHNYLLRSWLVAGGIHPDHDVRLTVVPPQQMVNYLESGVIDGYCVGEPWNQLAVERGSGSVVATGFDVWNNAPDKVLAVRKEWAEQNPKSYKALVAAMLAACQWLDSTEHRQQLPEMLRSYFPQELSTQVIGAPLNGKCPVGQGVVRELPDFNVFHRYAANMPWKSHGLWTLSQMYRWGQLTQPLNANALVDRVYQPEIYRQVATALGVSTPKNDYKAEGVHGSSYQAEGNGVTLGADLMIGEQQFQPGGWLESLSDASLHSRVIDLSSLRVANGYDADR